MKERIITGIGIAVVGIPIVILSNYIVYPIFLGLLALIGVWELLRVFGLQNSYEISIPAYLIAFALPTFAHSSLTPMDKHVEYLLFVAAVIFAYLLYLIAVCVFKKERQLKALEGDSDVKIVGFSDVAAVFTSVSYVTVSFTSLSLMRYMNNGGKIFGLVFVAAWMCDTFAYFTGRFFGKHKLAPYLSPKKTVEGSVGGILFAIIGCMVYGLIVEAFTDLEANFVVLGLLGLVLSVISPIGDIWASLIKREHGIKDYSRMLPGHGGVMDRFDSILAISTVLMAVCMKFPPFA